MSATRRPRRKRTRLPGLSPLSAFRQPQPGRVPTAGAPGEQYYEGPLISVRAAARKLRVHPTTVRRRAARGQIALHRSMVGLGITEDELTRAREQAPRRGRPIGKTEAAPEVAERVIEMREAGLGYAEIARRLNADGVPTARGGRQWWPSSVCSLCATLGARAS